MPRCLHTLGHRPTKNWWFSYKLAGVGGERALPLYAVALYQSQGEHWLPVLLEYLQGRGGLLCVMVRCTVAASSGATALLDPGRATDACVGGQAGHAVAASAQPSHTSVAIVLTDQEGNFCLEGKRRQGQACPSGAAASSPFGAGRTWQ
ncbi:unnamed protein product [Natator depressus]